MKGWSWIFRPFGFPDLLFPCEPPSLDIAIRPCLGLDRTVIRKRQCEARACISDGSMYHVLVQTLAHAVLEYIRKHELLRAGDRVGAAVSGGADSVAMLRVLLELRRELGIVLSLVHFNHQLRGAESDADERFVAELAGQHRLQLHCERGDVSAYAAAKHLSVEAAARELRYKFIRRLLAGKLNRVATAHTLDDQAETVLLRIVRGAGSRGLAGIYPQLSVGSSQFPGDAQASAISHPAPTASIVRPMLGCRRTALENYLREMGQDWREDKSNRDLRHARNRVRHGILPRLERNLNPAVREALAETAEIARAEEEYFEQEVAGLVQSHSDEKGLAQSFNLAELRKLPLALQRRVVRAAGEQLGLSLEFRHVEEVLGLIADHAGRRSVVLPDGWRAARTREALRFEAASSEKQADYNYCLTVPGSVAVPELGSRFEARFVQRTSAEVYNPEHLLNRELLAEELRVRNWHPRDRFWPAHSKAPKKVKELLQDRHVVAEERKHWPVVVSGEKLVWLRGFPAPAELQAKGGAGIVIREEPFELGE